MSLTKINKYSQPQNTHKITKNIFIYTISLHNSNLIHIFAENNKTVNMKEIFYSLFSKYLSDINKASNKISGYLNPMKYEK